MKYGKSYFIKYRQKTSLINKSKNQHMILSFKENGFYKRKNLEKTKGFFYPVTDKDLKIKRYKLILKNEKFKNEKDAYFIEKIDEEEKKAVLFGISSLAVLNKFSKFYKAKKHEVL